MRRNGERDTEGGPLVTPGAYPSKPPSNMLFLNTIIDIRTLYVRLILSFLEPTVPSSIKSTFLVHKDVFTGIFKDISRDHYTVIEEILQVSWKGLWGDQKIRRTTKVGLFGEWTLQQVSSGAFIHAQRA
jgi:hypothetical protein